jgi:hypothetical protein
MLQPQLPEEMVIEFDGVHAGAGQLSAQGAFANAPGAFEDRNVHPFGEKGQSFGHSAGMRLEPAKNRVPPHRKLMLTRLAV